MNLPEWNRVAARPAIVREISVSAVLTYLAVAVPVTAMVAALGALTSRVLVLLLMVAALAPMAVAVGKFRLYMRAPQRVTVTPSGLIVERNSGTEEVSSQSITGLTSPTRKGGYLYVGRETGRSIRLGPGLGEQSDFVNRFREMYEEWGHTRRGVAIEHALGLTVGPEEVDSRTATAQGQRMTPALVMAGASILLAFYLSVFLALEDNLAASALFALVALMIAMWALRV